jgi:S-methylmethionine-dependent homocysteine/selenocysteine methylase
LSSQIRALADDLQQAGTRVQQAVAVEAHAAAAQIEAEAQRAQSAVAVTYTETGALITGAPDVVGRASVADLASELAASVAAAGARVVGGQ